MSDGAADLSFKCAVAAQDLVVYNDQRSNAVGIAIGAAWGSRDGKDATDVGARVERGALLG